MNLEQIMKDLNWMEVVEDTTDKNAGVFLQQNYMRLLVNGDAETMNLNYWNRGYTTIQSSYLHSLGQQLNGSDAYMVTGHISHMCPNQKVNEIEAIMAHQIEELEWYENKRWKE